MPQKRNQQHKESDSQYEAFIRTLRLVDLGLQSCSASLNRLAYYELVSDKKAPARKITALYKVSRVDEGKSYFDALASFELKIGDHDGQREGLRLECVIEAHLHTTGKMPRALVDRFTQSEFRLVVWPYFRQFVTDTTARMAIRPVTIPFSVGPVASRRTVSRVLSR